MKKQPKRMSPLQRSAIAAVVVIGMIASGCLDLPKPEPTPITVLAVALDQSTPEATSRRCAELSARLRTTLRRPGVKRLDLLVLGTGDEATAFEPIAVVPWMSWSPDAGIFEHPEKAETAREEWIAAVRTACETSIHMAVWRAAASVRSRCAELESRGAQCSAMLLAAHSDLRENVEVHLRPLLDDLSRELEGKKRRRGALSAIPPIDTAGMEVKVCGISDTGLGRGERFIQPAVIIDVWKDVLGVDASAFDAACPTDGAAKTRSKARR